MNILKKDDWELTKRDLENQRVQLLLQLEIVNAGINRCQEVIDKLAKDKNEE